MTIDEARALASGFPGVIENEHHGHPDFRANGRMFATLVPTKGKSALRLPTPMAADLSGEAGFDVKSMKGRLTWVVVHLGSVDVTRYAGLVEVAYACTDDTMD